MVKGKNVWWVWSIILSICHLHYEKVSANTSINTSGVLTIFPDCSASNIRHTNFLSGARCTTPKTLVMEKLE